MFAFPWDIRSASHGRLIVKRYGLINQTHHGNATAVNNPIVPTNVGIRDVGQMKHAFMILISMRS